MSQENQITLRGYLTAEPKLYQRTSQAIPVTEIRVGSTPRRLNRETGEWQDLPTVYYRVKAWRRLAINTASSLKKGDRVIIRGHFYMDNWVDNQQRPRSTIEVEADTVGHDLTYGWSHYLRGTRPPESGTADSGEMARQDTGAANSGAIGDDEYVPYLQATGLDEPAEAVPPPDAPVQVGAGSWDSGVGDRSPVDGRDERGQAAGRSADADADAGDGDTPGSGAAQDTSSASGGLGSLADDLNALEREAVPF